MEDKITYICLKCGDVAFSEPHKTINEAKQLKCSNCNLTMLTANTKNMPNITEEQYYEMLKNNLWDQYLIDNMPHFPYIKNLKTTQIKNEQKSQYSAFTVKCPTCGCTEVQKISNTSKVINAGVFGLLGNKRRYQYECLNPNCKYMW